MEPFLDKGSIFLWIFCCITSRSNLRSLKRPNLVGKSGTELQVNGRFNESSPFEVAQNYMCSSVPLLIFWDRLLFLLGSHVLPPFLG